MMPGSTVAESEGRAAIATKPLARLESARVLSSAESRSRRIRSRTGASSRPMGVNCTDLVLRSTSRTPSDVSSRRICTVNVGWEMCTVFAARVKLPCLRDGNESPEVPQVDIHSHTLASEPAIGVERRTRRWKHRRYFPSLSSALLGDTDITGGCGPPIRSSCASRGSSTAPFPASPTRRVRRARRTCSGRDLRSSAPCREQERGGPCSTRVPRPSNAARFRNSGSCPPAGRRGRPNLDRSGVCPRGPKSG